VLGRKIFRANNGGNKMESLNQLKKPKFLSKESKPMTTILLVSAMFLILGAMIIFLLIAANKEVQKDYNNQCADLCYDSGRYMYSNDMCTCIDAEDKTTNYFIMDGEFVMIEQNK